jgi:hypothetical protein
MWPIETIEAFDLFLRGRGLRFDGVVIGGTALSLLGIVSRPTKDVDILVPIIPQEIHVAARFRSGNSRDRRDLIRRLAEQRTRLAG